MFPLSWLLSGSSPPTFWDFGKAGSQEGKEAGSKHRNHQGTAVGSSKMPVAVCMQSVTASAIQLQEEGGAALLEEKEKFTCER